MTAVRIIPRLDIKGPNLVKGIHLEGLRVLGDPALFAQHYYQSGADELFYMDVVASLFGRNSLNDIISKTARNIFIPITVGGGLRTISDIHQALNAGADRVCINTAAIKNPDFISAAAREFGTSTIVVAIEVIRQKNGEPLAFIDNGREHTGLNAFAWAEKVQSLGAGEIVLTSVDKDGTGEGFDLELIKEMKKILKIPLIAHGGAGSPEHVHQAVNAGANAVAIASVLHYDFVTKTPLNNSLEGNTQFLAGSRTFKKIIPNSIEKIKTYLAENQIEIRT